MPTVLPRSQTESRRRSRLLSAGFDADLPLLTLRPLPASACLPARRAHEYNRLQPWARLAAPGPLPLQGPDETRGKVRSLWGDGRC